MIDVSLQNKLRRADYTLLRYRLRFTEDFLLPAYALLRLRRELSRVLKSGLCPAWNQEDFRALLQPPLPVAPGLLRLVQQPAPGFILRIDRVQAQRFSAGELLTLSVCFFARGIQLVEPFSSLLEALGALGLCGNAGRFSLESIESDSASQPDEKLWCGGPFQIVSPIHDLTHRLEGFSPPTVRFELLTPARLLSNSRPLFQPCFAEIFPFILRRVSGMLAVWGELDDLFDAQDLIECATRLVESDNRWHWHDWRPLKGRAAGGLSGSLTLSGPELDDLWPLLRIGELFGIGKGAAFGAGRYRLN